MANGKSTKKGPTAEKKPQTRKDFIEQKWRGTGPPPLLKKK